MNRQVRRRHSATASALALHWFEMLQTLQLTVTGMTCGGCESAVTRVLGQIDGVEDVSASHAANLVGVVYDTERVTRAILKERIEELGYVVAPSPPE